MISYANTLKKLRISHSLTQSEVAEVIGIDRSTYAYYERGVTKPDFECIIKLCKFYKVELNDIANMFLKDDQTSITFRTIDDNLFDKDSYLNDLDMLNVDDYEKMILFFYRHLSEKYKKLFFVKIKQSFDEISAMNAEDEHQ